MCLLCKKEKKKKISQLEIHGTFLDWDLGDLSVPYPPALSILQVGTLRHEAEWRQPGVAPTLLCRQRMGELTGGLVHIMTPAVP